MMSTELVVDDVDDDDITFPYWYIGVIVAIAGSFIDSLGWMIEKKSHIELHQKHGHFKSVQYLKHCRWWVGFLTHTLGTIIFAASLGLAKQTLIAPLGSFVLLFNCVFANRCLHERLSRFQVLGTLVILGGCCLAIVFGPRHSSVIHNAAQLQHRFYNVPFIVFSICVCVIFMANYALYKRQCIALASNTNYIMFCEVSFSAFFGSWDSLFTKMFVELIGSSSQAHSWRNWTHFLPYVCFLSIIVCAVSLEYWRQKALRHFPANYVSGIYNTLIIAGGVSFGALFFGEFEGVKPGIVVLFVLSVCVSFVGVAMLTIGDDWWLKAKTYMFVEQALNAPQKNADMDSPGEEKLIEVTMHTSVTNDHVS